MKKITLLLVSALALNSYGHESRFTLPVNRPHIPQAIDLKSVAKNYQLVFFFADQCRYCHQFAPVVKAITDDYHLKLVTYSFDGKGILGLTPPLKVDQKVIDDYFTGISIACPLLAVKHKSGKISVLSQGLTSKAQVLEQLKAVVAKHAQKDDEAAMLKKYVEGQLKHRESNA